MKTSQFNKLTDRFRRLYDPEKAKLSQIILAGIGTIGSHLVPDLMRMGIGQIVAFDPDVVSEENIGVQNYNLHDVNISKAEGMNKAVYDLPGRERITMVEAVVNLDILAEMPKDSLWLIDVRTGGSMARVFTIDMKNEEFVNAYIASLYPDSEASTICGQTSVMYTSRMTCAIIEAQIMKVLTRGTDQIYHEIICQTREMAIEKREPKVTWTPKMKYIPKFVISAVDSIRARAEIAKALGMDVDLTKFPEEPAATEERTTPMEPQRSVSLVDLG